MSTRKSRHTSRFEAGTWVTSVHPAFFGHHRTGIVTRCEYDGAPFVYALSERYRDELPDYVCYGSERSEDAIDEEFREARQDEVLDAISRIERLCKVRRRGGKRCGLVMVDAHRKLFAEARDSFLRKLEDAKDAAN